MATKLAKSIAEKMKENQHHRFLLLSRLSITITHNTSSKFRGVTVLSKDSKGMLSLWPYVMAIR